MVKPCPTFATASTIAHQPHLSTRFLRQNYWSGLPFPIPGNHPDPGIELAFLHWQDDSYHWATREAHYSLLSSKKRKERKKVKLFSSAWLFATPWTVAYKAPLSMGFSRQEHWSGLLFPFSVSKKMILKIIFPIIVQKYCCAKHAHLFSMWQHWHCKLMDKRTD